MANLKEIRSRIKSVGTTQQLTKAMKMVAAAKLRRAQDNVIKLRPYANKMMEIMDDITENLPDGVDSPFTELRQPDSVLIVVVTSDRGLCGPFNNNVIKGVTEMIQGKYASQSKEGKLEFIMIGKKAFDFFSGKGHKIIGENREVYTDLNFETVSEISQEVMDGFIEKRWDKIELIYNEFKNVISQNKVEEDFLPLAPDSLVSETKKKAKYNADYIFSPDKEKILESLIPKKLRLQFFKAVLESYAGEQGARMTAMDNATTNAEELIKDLKLTYNRARQAAITTEILEIVGGANALESSN